MKILEKVTKTQKSNEILINKQLSEYLPNPGSTPKNKKNFELEAKNVNI